MTKMKWRVGVWRRENYGIVFIIAESVLRFKITFFFPIFVDFFLNIFMIIDFVHEAILTQGLEAIQLRLYQFISPGFYCLYFIVIILVFQLIPNSCY